MNEAVIVSAVRTASGKAHKGSFSQTRVEDLGRAVLEEAVRRTPGLNKADVEDVILGCAMPEGEQGLNVARIMSLYAGFPVTTPAITVNRFCASGLQAVAFAAERIMAGYADVIVAGGAESMSHVPMSGFRFSPHPVLSVEYPEIYLGMGLTAEYVAERYGVSREDQDRYAAASHRKAAEAIRAGKFKEEIVPVHAVLRSVDDEGTVTSVKKVLDADEGVLGGAGADQFVELGLDRRAVPVLRVLDQENHQEGDDGGAGVDDELPAIGEAEDRPRHGPGVEERLVDLAQVRGRAPPARPPWSRRSGCSTGSRRTHRRSGSHSR